MKCSAVDPSSPDSPHIEGLQPSHCELPFACVVLALRAERPQDPWQDIRDTLHEHASENKVDEVASILRKLGCLADPDDTLTGSGATIAGVFEQSELDGENMSWINKKEALTSIERALFQSLLLEHDPIPMLAVLNQVETESVACGNSDARTAGFIDRVGYLANYDRTWKENTKETKTEVHFDWAEHLDWVVPAGSGNRYELTSTGRELRKQLDHLRPEEWTVPSEQNTLPGTE